MVYLVQEKYMEYLISFNYNSLQLFKKRKWENHTMELAFMCIILNNKIKMKIKKNQPFYLQPFTIQENYYVAIC